MIGKKAGLHIVLHQQFSKILEVLYTDVHSERSDSASKIDLFVDLCDQSLTKALNTGEVVPLKISVKLSPNVFSVVKSFILIRQSKLIVNFRSEKEYLLLVKSDFIRDFKTLLGE